MESLIFEIFKAVGKAAKSSKWLNERDRQALDDLFGSDDVSEQQKFWASITATDKGSKRRESLPVFASKSSENRTSSPYDSSSSRPDGVNAKKTWSCLYCGAENDFSQQTCECRKHRHNQDNLDNRSTRETDHKNSSHTTPTIPRKTSSTGDDDFSGWAPEENTSSWVNFPIFVIGVIFLLIIFANR